MKAADIADSVLRLESPHPVRVAIDGFCAAGKSTLAAELALEIRSRGRSVIRVCGDDFQNSPEVRYQLGPRSPEGFFRHSMNFAALRSELLEPLGPSGSLRYRTSVYDVFESRPNLSPEFSANASDVLLLDGLFLHVPALDGCFDFSVFVATDYETCVARAKVRKQERSKDPNAIEASYRERYVPGFELYVAEVRPTERATVVVSGAR